VECRLDGVFCLRAFEVVVDEGIFHQAGRLLGVVVYCGVVAVVNFTSGRVTIVVAGKTIGYMPGRYESTPVGSEVGHTSRWLVYEEGNAQSVAGCPRVLGPRTAIYVA
jgi:hypothetical protein